MRICADVYELAPVVQYAMDNHPLWFNAVTVEPLLHHSIVGVLALPLLIVELLLSRAIVIWWWLVHLILALVVPIHDRVVQLQLHNRRQTKQSHSGPPLAKDCNIGSIHGIETNLINYSKFQNGFI